MPLGKVRKYDPKLVNINKTPKKKTDVTNNSSEESCYSDSEKKDASSSKIDSKALESSIISPSHQEVPTHKLRKFLYVEAEILEIKSLNFYIHLVESCYADPLLELQNKLNSFYANQNNCQAAHNYYPGFYGTVKDHEGNWRRCVLKEIKEESLQVFLLDIGRNINIKKSELKSLDASFRKRQQGSVHCKLAYVTQKPSGPYSSERASKEFKKLIEDSKKIFVLFTRIAENDDPHSVVVYTLPGNGLKININIALALELNCIESTDFHNSKKMITRDVNYVSPRKQNTPNPEAIQKVKRVEVTILGIVNPSLFFVMLKSREQEIQQLHEAVRKEALEQLLDQAMSYHRVETKLWRAGDFCIAPLHDKEEVLGFFRGRVLRDVRDGKWQVFLIDKGIIIFVKSEDMLVLPKSLESPDAAVKMHMAGAEPTGGKKWSFSAIDGFRHIMSRFSMAFVSIVGEKNENNSLPVIVWGVVTKQFDFSDQKQFHNISFYMFNEGLVDNPLMKVPERLLESERFVSDEDFKLDGRTNASPLLGYETADLDETENLTTVKVGSFMISVVPQSIKSWLPAEQTSATEFNGIVTAVVSNKQSMVISIRDEDQESTFHAMTKEVTKIYSEIMDEEFGKEIERGDAVIVQNIFNAKYYRGIVEAFSISLGYYVRLIDIGSAAYIKREHLHTSVIAFDVPVQVRNYRFTSILPQDGEHEWPQKILDFIYCKLVDSKVTVNVIRVDDVSECSIRFSEQSFGGKNDVEKVVVDLQLARWRRPDEDLPTLKNDHPSEFFDDFEHNKILFIKKKQIKLENDQMAAEINKPAEIDVSMEKTKKYLNEYDKELNIEVVTSKLSLSNRKSKTPVSNLNVSKSLAFETINDQLSQRNHRRQRLEKTIEQFDLRAHDIQMFSCTFVDIFENTTVFVEPHINEMDDQIKKLTESLNEINEPVLLKINRPEKHLKQPCLVNKDNTWHRGTIIEASTAEQIVKVFLIDFAKYQNFLKTEIYKIPMTVANFPRKILTVEIIGIKVNCNNAVDWDKELKTILQGKQLHAIVQGFDEKENPLVKLVTPNGKLAYQTLIDQNVFLTL